jgi:DNA-binding MarR family transcriptional regulator
MDTSSYSNFTGYLMQHVSDVLGKQSDQILLERLGIGISQVKILMVLQANPDARQKQIARRLGQTEASISRQLKVMTSKFLLRSVTNQDNRREHITSLTLKGERLVQEAMSIISYYHQPVFDKLNPKQQEQFLESLKLMHQATCQGNRIGSCDHPFIS